MHAQAGHPLGSLGVGRTLHGWARQRLQPLSTQTGNKSTYIFSYFLTHSVNARHFTRPSPCPSCCLQRVGERPCDLLVELGGLKGEDAVGRHGSGGEPGRGHPGRPARGRGLCTVVCRPRTGDRGEKWGMNTPRESSVELLWS